MVSFHLEAVENDRKADDILSEIRLAGAKAGLVINPDIPVERLYPHLENADYFLIMSVFAGFGGQKFIPETVQKIRTLRALIDARGLSCEIEVDGGINPETAARCIDAGASILVAGNSVFSSDTPAEMIRALRCGR